MDIFETTRIKLSNQGLRIDRYDLNRPWGGFFVLDENQAQQFADIYFEGLDVGPLRIAGKLSPKILLVKPEARLSWQYHHRRAETWRVVEGPVALYAVLQMKKGSWFLLKQVKLLSWKKVNAIV